MMCFQTPWYILRSSRKKVIDDGDHGIEEGLVQTNHMGRCSYGSKKNLHASCKEK